MREGRRRARERLLGEGEGEGGTYNLVLCGLGAAGEMRWEETGAKGGGEGEAGREKLNLGRLGGCGAVLAVRWGPAGLLSDKQEATAPSEAKGGSQSCVTWARLGRGGPMTGSSASSPAAASRRSSPPASPRRLAAHHATALPRPSLPAGLLLADASPHLASLALPRLAAPPNAPICAQPACQTQTQHAARPAPQPCPAPAQGPSRSSSSWAPRPSAC